jgi:hypothetical protein
LVQKEGGFGRPFRLPSQSRFTYTRLMQRSRSVLLFLLACAPAQAAIYKYVDADGNVTLTDRYRPGAIKLLDTDTPARPTTISTPRQNNRSAKPSPAGFPRVDSTTQRQRDDIRRSVLQEERSKEMKGLETAQATLDTPVKRPQDELDRLNASIARHKKNIEMLDKELARLK